MSEHWLEVVARPGCAAGDGTGIGRRKRWEGPGLDSCEVEAGDASVREGREFSGTRFRVHLVEDEQLRPKVRHVVTDSTRGCHVEENGRHPVEVDWKP